MPQIWPMNWVILFVLFSLTFVAYLSSVYFFRPDYEISSQGQSLCPVSQNMEWKW